jgi:hypothetical protein
MSSNLCLNSAIRSDQRDATLAKTLYIDSIQTRSSDINIMRINMCSNDKICDCVPQMSVAFAIRAWASVILV